MFALAVFSGICTPVLGQTIIFEESFGNWSNAAPVNWTIAGSTPGWAPADSLSAAGMPAPAGCDAIGSYLRFPASILTSQTSSLISPALNLSSFVGDSLSLEMCLINPGPTNGEGDGIQVFFSKDGGTTWIDQGADSNVYSIWTGLTFALPDSFKTAQFRMRIDGIGALASVDPGLDLVRIIAPLPTCLSEPTSIAGGIQEYYCPADQPITVQLSNTGSGASPYAYLVTDALDQIITVINTPQASLPSLLPGEYHIHGVSYTGGLIAPVTQLLSSVSATGCAILSLNFLEFTVIQIEANTLITSNYNGFNVSTATSTDGSAYVTVSGGSGAYQYEWSSVSGVNQDTIFGLPGGLQSVTITDSITGCVVTDSLFLSAPSALIVSLGSDSSYSGFGVRCPGNTDGAISAQIQGGVPPFTYSWNHDAQLDSANATHLGTGWYSLLVTDANGTTALDSIELSAPSPIAIQIDNLKPACAGQQDGALFLSAQGGTGLYRFTWDHGPLGNILAGLAPDTYRVEVQDNNNCLVSQEFIIEEAVQPIVVPEAIDPSCFEVADGTIDLFELAGEAPFFHLWQQGDTGKVLTDLAPGNYQVFSVDAYGCRDTNVIRLNAPAPLRATYTSTPDDGNGTGTATILATGGTPPYSALWPSGDTSLTTQHLSIGPTTALLVDGNGCDLSLEIDIAASPTPDCLSENLGFSPNGDGINDFWEIPCIQSFRDQEIQVLNRWGQRVYYSLDYAQPWDGRSAGENLPSGTYYYLIRATLDEQPLEFKGTLSIVR